MTDTNAATTQTASTAPGAAPHDLPDVSGLVVGVLGGTGEQGRGLAEENVDGGLALAEVRRHRGLAVARHALVFQFDQHRRGRGAGTPRQAERVPELEGVGAVAQDHPEGQCSDG